MDSASPSSAELREQIAELELALFERDERIEQLEKELESFSYSISHDLRTPLRHIAGFADLLLQSSLKAPSNEADQRHLRIIADSALRLSRLIEDLLEFSKAGKMELRKEEIDLKALIEEILGELRADIGKRYIVFEIGKLPQVIADRMALKLALSNLVLNAIKFTRTRERAAIEISCSSDDEKQSTIFVKDNGIGYDMKYASRLFGVFQRLHRAEEFEGSGIGLASARRIVHRHGGQIWAEGAVDQGAAFYVSLPKPSTKL